GGGGADLSSYRDYSEALARLSALDTESFRVMANRVVQKLGYKVDQILPTYRDTDGVDFMTVSVSTKEKTLIWVRRWTKITVGEIPLRNLAQSTNDLKARQGILITAAELTPAAEESLSRLSKVSVVHPDQLGEILDGLL
ncbi:MAG TPA: restriction endonuclease, partial [Spirochaetota bacterium]|nr:restriction endonuclease [Spirochaetota bacterium]